MADEEKKDETQAETPEETKPAEAPVEEAKPEEKPKEEIKEEVKEEAPAEAEPEPVSAISPEMQSTTGHTGKITGAEDIRPGMTVQIHERILDISPKGEERERTQVFEGIVLGVRGAGNKKTVTVRKISHGVGVEKVFPLASPNVTKIEVIKVARVRRAKLTFLKNLKKRFKKKLKETRVE